MTDAEPAPDLLPAVVEPPTSDVDARLDSLLADAANFARHARAEATLRGYRSDWSDFRTWCLQMGQDALPALPETVAAYLVALTRLDAATGTLARRLSSIGHHHRASGQLDPTVDAGVRYVMAGIRRELGRKPDRATPLMPPLLWDALEACPTLYDGHDGPEPHLRGLRDRAILLVGFVGALRRSELAAADVADVHEHPLGLVLDIPRSKTRHDATQAPETVVLPRSRTPQHCPVTQLRTWLDSAGITTGPLFQGTTPRGNRLAAGGCRLAGARINSIVQEALRRAGVDPDADGYSAHSLRAGFVTYAASRGASDRAIARQTRHRDLANVGIYTRHESAWTDNAATELGL